MLWVASKALGISPFSKEFASLSEAQITWAVINHYKDQEEDLEKYKLICRFTNPEAAQKLFDKDYISPEEQISKEFLDEIRKHSKSDLDDDTLRKSLTNPQSHLLESNDHLDTIKAVD